MHEIELDIFLWSSYISSILHLILTFIFQVTIATSWTTLGSIKPDTTKVRRRRIRRLNLILKMSEFQKISLDFLLVWSKSCKKLFREKIGLQLQANIGQGYDDILWLVIGILKINAFYYCLCKISPSVCPFLYFGISLLKFPKCKETHILCPCNNC